MNLHDQLIELEGRKNKAYPDPLTKGAPYTIGVGHTGKDVTKNTVWDDKQIDESLNLDIKEKTKQVMTAMPWVAELNEARQAVIIGMAFQMGVIGLLAFKNTLAAVKSHLWVQASKGMLASKWAKQTPNRAKLLARQMLTGKFQKIDW